MKGFIFSNSIMIQYHENQLNSQKTHEPLGLSFPSHRRNEESRKHLRSGALQQ